MASEVGDLIFHLDPRDRTLSRRNNEEKMAKKAVTGSEVYRAREAAFQKPPYTSACDVFERSARAEFGGFPLSDRETKEEYRHSELPNCDRKVQDEEMPAWARQLVTILVQKLIANERSSSPTEQLCQNCHAQIKNRNQRETGTGSPRNYQVNQGSHSHMSQKPQSLCDSERIPIQSDTQSQMSYERLNSHSDYNYLTNPTCISVVDGPGPASSYPRRVQSCQVSPAIDPRLSYERLQGRPNSIRDCFPQLHCRAREVNTARPSQEYHRYQGFEHESTLSYERPYHFPDGDGDFSSNPPWLKKALGQDADRRHEWYRPPDDLQDDLAIDEYHEGRSRRPQTTRSTIREPEEDSEEMYYSRASLDTIRRLTPKGDKHFQASRAKPEEPSTVVEPEQPVDMVVILQKLVQTLEGLVTNQREPRRQCFVCGGEDHLKRDCPVAHQRLARRLNGGDDMQQTCPGEYDRTRKVGHLNLGGPSLMVGGRSLIQSV